MKKRLKTLISLIICMSTMFCCAFSANGEFIDNTCTAEDSTETFTESEQMSSDNEETVVKDAENVVPEVSTERIAKLYLCSYGIPSGKYLFGHCWVCIKNTGDETLFVGEQAIEPGETISAGLHHSGGMKFNEEMQDFKGKSVRSLEYDLTREDFQKVADEILSSKWHWYELFTHNCTNFAVSVWHTATGNFMVAFCFPFIVSIQMMGAEKVNFA